jgi:hypothetical protein
MSKYIIDIPKTVGMLETVGSVRYTYFDGIQVQTIVLKGDEIEELNSDYINEHFGDLQDTAYQKGFEDGKWKSEDGCTGCKYEGKVVTGQPCISCCNSYKNQWTAKDDKIEVGDTVNLKDGSRDNDGIVTKSWDNDRHFIMWADGSGGVWDKEYIVKTGRHFDIASILEEMRND